MPERNTASRLSQGLAGIALLFFVHGADAGLFSLAVQETGGTPIAVADNASLDLNPLAGAITVDTVALNAALTHYRFVNLGGSSTAEDVPPVPDPWNFNSVLTHTGEVTRVSRSGVASLSITATDNGFGYPLNPRKQMWGAASDTYCFTTAGDNRTFQCFYDSSNLPGGTANPSNLLTMSFSGQDIPVSTGNETSNTIATVPSPYSVMSMSVVTLAPNGAYSQPPRDQFSGMVVIRAIPEPHVLTLALISAGIPAVRRSRKR